MKLDKLILASGSPRRREILEEMGLAIDVVPSEVDESSITADHPRTFALRAAYLKALDVGKNYESDTWILAADTVVTQQMRLFGKPRDEVDARKMLERFSGSCHEVITGVALAKGGSQTCFLAAEKTLVYFRDLTESDILPYLETGEPYDKAGAYGIQGEGGNLVKRIEGDYYNVVGLPCKTVLELFDEAGFDVNAKPLTVPERWK